MAAFCVGDDVRPRPEWVGDPNIIPSGAIREIAKFGTDGALYVGDERRAFASYVFEKVSQNDLFQLD